MDNKRNGNGRSDNMKNNNQRSSSQNVNRRNENTCESAGRNSRGVERSTNIPTDRRNSAAPVKKPTKEQIERMRAEQAERARVYYEEKKRLEIYEKEKRRQKAAERKQKRSYMLALFIIFLLIFLSMMIVTAAAFFISLNFHEDSDKTSYYLTISDYYDKSTFKNGSVVYDNGVRYVNFSKFAEENGFSMVGSIDKMKYVIKNNIHETVSFEPDSSSVNVNGTLIRTEGEAFYTGTDLFVPLSFLSEYIKGVDVSVDDTKQIVSIKRKIENLVDENGKIIDGKDPIYPELEFLLKAPVTSSPIDEYDVSDDAPALTYVSNVTPYEEYINPGITTEFLTVVNDSNILSADYEPTGLRAIKGFESVSLKEYAAKACEALLNEARACGISDITISRAYVSYDNLEKKRTDFIEEQIPLIGREQAERYVDNYFIRPGADEHQSGLAVNFSTKTGADFASSATYIWLTENAYKFGYVLRYPKDKTGVTGSEFDPTWFRYVGSYHSVRMRTLDMTLEEYVNYINL